MKSGTLLIAFLLFLNSLVHAQSDVICIPYGSSVMIDGIISHQEWQDADSLFLGTSIQTKVMYKHDSLNLLVAYVGHLESSSRIPELIIDINNDKSATWSSDDWWFHVSAQDCDYQGVYANYDSCAYVRPTWTAVENMDFGVPQPPFNDTVEIEIPFSTLHLTLSETDTIGISFLVTNLFSTWTHWPVSANRNNPSTWGSAVFDCGSLSSVSKPISRSVPIALYPNPSEGEFVVKFPEGTVDDKLILKISDPTGKVIWQRNYNDSRNSAIPINVTNYAGGVYFLTVEGKDFFASEKIILGR